MARMLAGCTAPRVSCLAGPGASIAIIAASLVEEPGKPQRDLRNVSDQEQDENVADQERPDRLADLAERDLGDVRRHEQAHAYRRRRKAAHEIEHGEGRE